MLPQAEAEEEPNMEEAEAPLFTTIKLSTWKDTEQQIGSTRHIDLVDHDRVCVADFALCCKSSLVEYTGLQWGAVSGS